MQYLCECSDFYCRLGAEVPNERAREIVSDPRVYLIVDGCQRGPDPGDTLVSAEMGWRLYRLQSRTLTEKEKVD